MNSQRGRLGVLKIEEYLFEELFDTKYLQQVSYLCDACAHRTAVYPVQRVCLSWSSISLHHRYCCLPYTTFHNCLRRGYVITEFVPYLSRMNSQCVHYVCCKSTSTRLKERFEMKY